MNATLQRLQDHPLADAIRDLPALRLFMEHHVFAVWDFQVLLRALERKLTSPGQADLQAVPAAAAEFLQRIVAEEERDLAPANPSGASHLSHLEIYLLAMEEVGASTKTIKALLACVGHGRTHGFQAKSLERALKGLPIPKPSRQFMAFTFEVMASDEAPLMAAAFAHGRELLVPRLFQSLLERALIPQERAPSLHWYFMRHIGLDGEDHGPLARRILADLCGDSIAQQQATAAIAERAIEARLRFWDGIHKALAHAGQRS